MSAIPDIVRPMPLASLTTDQIRAAVPQLEAVAEVDRGGQKIVYRAEVGGEPCALKVVGIPGVHDGGLSLTAEVIGEVVARAGREVDIMRCCQSPHVVKPGPLPLTLATIDGVNVAYFTEEWIEGQNVRTIIAGSGPLPLDELSRLGISAMHAIHELWTIAKVHRDIKPANIMRRTDTGEYVVLDMGLALDLEGDSLTKVVGAIPGTPIYFSPERIDLARKRELDFRSDMFSLGIVLYEAATGVHPFWRPGMSRDEGVRSIVLDTPPRPSSHRAGVGATFDAVCMRMLEKKMHLRFRRCDLAVEALNGLVNGED